jgi:hypothetical protein
VDLRLQSARQSWPLSTPHGIFNQEHHLVTRQVYKQRRTAALAEWRVLIAQIVDCAWAYREARRRSPFTLTMPSAGKIMRRELRKLDA